MHPHSKEIAKKALGKAAADLVQDGMIVGLGSGSTSHYFIKSLIERCLSTSLKIEVVPTSNQSAKLAQTGGLPTYNLNQLTSLDLCIDGADEVDSKMRMIKGGGGALLREKILATISREFIVIIDADKLVNQLGAFPLPIEILPFAHQATLHQISTQGYKGDFRRNSQGDFYVTDNGNYIIDIFYPNEYSHPEDDQAILQRIPGVLETGFFLKPAKKILVGHADGRVEVLHNIEN